MKRKIFVSILAVAALLLIVSCENIINEIIHSNSNVKYKVYFDTGEGSWPKW